jgi:hypothetical protein
MPARLPESVQANIKQDQDQSEILVSLLELLAVGTFAVLYAATQRRSIPSESTLLTIIDRWQYRSRPRNAVDL